LEDIPGDLREIMGPNEQVELFIKQKVYHPKINIDSVVITNERIILRHPHALGIKKDYTDFNYQDISNVILDKGITRSTVKLTLRLGGEPMSLNDLPNADAQKAYGTIRENLIKFQAPFSTGMAGIPPYAPGGSPPGGQGRACPKCGSFVAAGQRFCGSCGAPMQ
jgi:hypothetical protein